MNPTRFVPNASKGTVQSAARGRSMIFKVTFEFHLYCTLLVCRVVFTIVFVHITIIFGDP